MCNHREECMGREDADNALTETTFGVSVQLVFAAESNGEVPEIVGSILKSAYLQRQSA